jgi:hypothetical protein
MSINYPKSDIKTRWGSPDAYEFLGYPRGIMNRMAGEKIALSLWVGVMVGTVFSASETGSPRPKTYRVGEFIGVLSPDSFQCRLKDYEYSNSIRFRVYIRGISPKDASNQDTAHLTELLKAARQIELRNPVFRNYFRVEADVWADGKNLSEIVVGQNPALALRSVTALETAPAAQPYRARTVTSLPEPSYAVARPNTPAADVRKVTLQELLDTPVDCSMLRVETPFSEALEILCGSVTPRLPLVILWGDLEANALIEKESPIGVEGFGRMPLRQALQTVLRSVGTGELKPVLAVEGGIITLGTRQGLGEKNTTRVYSVEDLLMAPSQADEENQSGYGSQNRGYGR